MKTKKMFLIIVAGIISFALIFGTIDYLRINNNNKPLFTLFKTQYKDGGTTEYFGLGYKIIKCNTLNGDISNNFGLYNLNIDKTCIQANEILPLYMKIIDNLMLGSKGGSEFLALDLNTFELLDEFGENDLIEYSKKYHNNVFKASYKDLEENGYVDGHELRGYLISINKFEKRNNVINLDVGRLKDSLGAKGFCYKAEFKKADWKIKETCSWLS